MSHGVFATVGVMLTAYAGLNLISGITSAGYRVVGLYPRQCAFVAVGRGLEYTVLVGLVVAGQQPMVCAAGFLVTRATFTCILLADYSLKTPWARPQKFGSSLRAVRRLALPSISYLGLTLGTIFRNQGMLVVASLAAPTLLVPLDTTMLLTNSFYQLFGLLRWRDA